MPTSCPLRNWWARLGFVDRLLYTSKFIWYSDKGDAEHHFTTNPRSEFGELSPASFLLMFQPRMAEEPYYALTVDANDDDLIDYITDVFGIDTDFQFKIFDARTLNLRPALSGMQQLISQLLSKLDEGPAQFDKYVSSLTRRPPQMIAAAALEQWMSETGNEKLHPYKLTNPGDVLYDLSRVREFNLYKQDEAKTYGAQLVRALLGEGRAISREGIVAALIDRFEVFYDICKSAKQARSSRAGGSFETHMMSALIAGGIPHNSQYVFDGSKPDFVLPTGELYANPEKRKTLGAVLTLKTTLRERWRQVVSESTDCPIFLATLDESVPGRTVEKLKEKGITLVVPEKFKTSEYTEYESHSNVLSYRNFFDMLLNDWADRWLSNGIGCFGIGPTS